MTLLGGRRTTSALTPRARGRARAWPPSARGSRPSASARRAWALDELLAARVRRTRLRPARAALPGGARRLANVRKLMRLAAAYEARRGRDVRGFIDRATAELEAEAREPDAPVELGGLDAVRLMTIHAAKGLEFGVVVVADLGRGATSACRTCSSSGDRVGLRLVSSTASGPTALDFDGSGRAPRGRRGGGAAHHARGDDARRGAADPQRRGAPRQLARAGTRRAPIGWLGPALVPGSPRSTRRADPRPRAACAPC